MIYETSIINPKKQLEFYKGLSEQLQQENQELKKQYEECVKINIADHKYASSCEDKVIVLEAQQKEFIDWLENEIENCKYGEENYADGDDMSYHNENELRIEILSKYKEIIGEKDE